MPENSFKNNNEYKTAFENELKELEGSREKLVACLTEKKGMESFLSQSTLEMIKKLRGEREVAIQGELRDVVIMFTDVRGFTRFSEAFGVKRVFEILNAYLSVQSKNITQYHGVLDKFLGDGIMAIFEGEQKELHALRAAIMIQSSVRKLNYEYTKRSVLNIGIGIHTGQVFMGVLGERGRSDYTAIGDNVNIASRLCSLAKGEEILFTEQFTTQLSQIKGIHFKDLMEVKGKKAPLNVYYYELDVGYPEISQAEKLPKQDIRDTSQGDKAHVNDQTLQEKASLPRTKIILTPKEKELIAVGASIASGCQQCADYHFVKVFDEGATVDEVKRAVHDASEMIAFASEVMQHKAYTFMNVSCKVSAKEGVSGDLDRLSLLVRIGAVVALNCITGIERYIKLALKSGVALEGIQMAIALAEIVATKAREFAEDKILKSLDMVPSESKISFAECHF